jgi:hypothetical protein
MYEAIVTLCYIHVGGIKTLILYNEHEIFCNILFNLFMLRIVQLFFVDYGAITQLVWFLQK